MIWTRACLSLVSVLPLALLPPGAQGQDRALAEAVAGLELRAIGPAVMGGRIADIAVHPHGRSTWYVAVGSGGVWKTTNAGVTWTPVFDDQPSYSVGVVTLDPTNPSVVWVGTGENVSGRHVGWGSGVYRSRDGGATWENVGLGASEHIGRILVDPRDGDRILVAAEGPLWTSGGDRGVYRSTDGGETWARVLAIDENTGVTDLEFHPTDPDVVYAATYQRRRQVWSFLAGGPQSGIFKSTDAGETWRRVTQGLPEGVVGKIGLAVTSADPDRVYATIEADEDERGFYRSMDRGESWERRNAYVSGGTGPHYYQEIEASPTDPELVYQMDVFLHVTRDGGNTFDELESGRNKHSDNHALWIDPDDGRHLIAGTDAGLYETFDEGTTWRHFPNLPVSQFYKVALSNSEPFYDILGGAQDLGTLLGPSRTANVEGVRNRDWSVPLGADGYGVAIDPDDSATLYLETQVGNLHRYHRPSDEALHIQPQPAPGDPPERWNWDAPLLISPHASNRLYFGSQRLWRSDDRGDSWTAVSGDLTRDRNRYELEVMGRVWSVDALYDHAAMSMYATLTAVSESPLAEGVLYTGSDDGLIHASSDGGQTWSRAGPLPGLPELAFINDLEASQHDTDGVFAVADAHKEGDDRPYVFASDDRGRTWRSIAGDLPDGTIVWAIQQDHVDPGLLFLATEYGLYVSPDGGVRWRRLAGGVPTIAFRDLKLQRRNDDLVGASFGRGFYVLDDYGPLRDMDRVVSAGESTLFPVRDAWWYVPNVPMQARGKPTLGSTDFTAPNPPFGAVFTYYLADVPPTLAESRRATEAELREQGLDIPFPGYEGLRAEAEQAGPRLQLTVRDTEGAAVRRLRAEARTGVQRVAWDLRGPPPDPVTFETPDFTPPWVTPPRGPLLPPGRYAVELDLLLDGSSRRLGEPQAFDVVAVPTAPAGTDFTVVTAFQRETADLSRRAAGADRRLQETLERLEHMEEALLRTPAADPALAHRIQDMKVSLGRLDARLNGDPIRGRLNEAREPSIRGRIGTVVSGHWETRHTPTETQRRSLETAARDFDVLNGELTALIDSDLTRLEADLAEAGAPWTPGRRVPPG